jgi:hypothetical protein
MTKEPKTIEEADRALAALDKKYPIGKRTAADYHNPKDRLIRLKWRLSQIKQGLPILGRTLGR